MTTTAPAQRRRYLPPPPPQTPHEQLLRPPPRRKGPNRFPGGYYDRTKVERRECLFFCVLVIILSVVLFYLMSILLYMHAFSSSFLFGGIDIDFHDDKPILIIGGTDGSGTRAFVDTLSQLGVVIVYDDPKTFDVHAAELFKHQGWPKFVTTVMKETHSANFQLADLDSTTQRILGVEMAKFRTVLSQKYTREKNKRKRRIQKMRRSPSYAAHHPDKLLPNDSDLVASKVSYAMKAPVSMMVLPVLQKMFDRPIKFLHVVRDGRDIALSDNQSPVLKFYETMYGNNSSRTTEEQINIYGSNDLPHVRAMHLWNDWNLQVQELLKKQSSSSTANGNIEFLTMRSEDLLSKETRWEALHALADFVGSPLTEEELCCKAYETTKDFGQSSVHKAGVNDPNTKPSPEYLQEIMKSIDVQNNLRNTVPSHPVGTDSIKVQHHLGPPHRRLAEVPEPTTKETFLADFAEYKGVVEQRGKAMQIEQLEEWVLHGEQLEQQWDSLQAQLSAEDAPGSSPSVDYGLDLKRLVATLNFQIRRKKNSKEFGGFVGGEGFIRTNSGPEVIANVHQRYGKWQKILATRPGLSKILHEEGKEALRVFGYEPERAFKYYTPPPKSTMTSSDATNGTPDTMEETFVCTPQVVCN